MTTKNTKNEANQFHHLEYNLIGPARVVTQGEADREGERYRKERAEESARVAAMSPADQIRHRLANCIGSAPTKKKQRRKLRLDLAQIESAANE